MNKVLPVQDMQKLSRNILVSHSIAVGDPMPVEWVRAGIVVRINSLIKGRSGVSLEFVQLLGELLNRNIIPCVPNIGSLACSGDLCFLAHVGLVISKPMNDDADNDVFYQDQRLKASVAMAMAGLERVAFGAKEGLALTNGSSFTAAIAALGICQAERLFKQNLASAALSMEAMLGCSDALEADIHDVRPHPGQVEVARSLRALLEGSKLINASDDVQDAYSLRCIPQVLGILDEVMDAMKDMLKIELNSVTDNPILSKSLESCFSGGNFHGAIIGQHADSLLSALTRVAVMTERRIARIVDDRMSRGLPSMLTPNPGLNSGYMIMQYTAAALALINQQSAMPASVLSIPTCCNQEDHNSNAFNSVVNLMKVLNNTQKIVAIETCCAIRALMLRKAKDKPSCGKGKFWKTKQLGRFSKSQYEVAVQLLHPDVNDHGLQGEFEQFERLLASNNYQEAIETVLTAKNAVTLGNPRGMVDFGPRDMLLRRKVFAQIQDIFKRRGVDQLETPVLEKREVLFGKYGDESQKLVFDLNYETGANCTMRFDLTVPFARYMAQNNLKTLRRFQFGPVFRRDNPSLEQGRYRGFYQFDMDIAGHFDKMVPDAEVVKCMSDVLESFKFDFKIKFSHKGLLDLILNLCGVPLSKSMTAASSLDKLDKEPWDRIEVELLNKGLDQDVVANLKHHILVRGPPRSVLQVLQEKYVDHVEIMAILADIDILFNYLDAFECLNKLEFDLSLARGLRYLSERILETLFFFC
jgi:histidine ammonia-lyase